MLSVIVPHHWISGPHNSLCSCQQILSDLTAHCFYPDCQSNSPHPTGKRGHSNSLNTRFFQQYSSFPPQL